MTLWLAAIMNVINRTANVGEQPVWKTGTVIYSNLLPWQEAFPNEPDLKEILKPEEYLK